jgi:hypothetical protein
MGVVECRSTLCIQLFKQGPSMRGCSRHGGSRGCWGDLEHRRPWILRFQSTYSPWRFHWNFYMIGKEGLRLREGKTETLTRTGHVSSCT